jgi:hypothetical protein
MNLIDSRVLEVSTISIGIEDDNAILKVHLWNK